MHVFICILLDRLMRTSHGGGLTISKRFEMAKILDSTLTRSCFHIYRLVLVLELPLGLMPALITSNSLAAQSVLGKWGVLELLEATKKQAHTPQFRVIIL